jgi:hypothetical protein
MRFLEKLATLHMKRLGKTCSTVVHTWNNEQLKNLCMKNYSALGSSQQVILIRLLFLCLNLSGPKRLRLCTRSRGEDWGGHARRQRPGPGAGGHAAWRTPARRKLSETNRSRWDSEDDRLELIVLFLRKRINTTIEGRLIEWSWPSCWAWTDEFKHTTE